MSAERDVRRNGQRIVGDRLDRLGRAVSFELLGRLMNKTPVDTGRARGNWNASIGSEDPAVDPDRRQPAALNEGRQRIAGLRLSKPGEKLFITNGLPYIRPLNDGHSRQAPSGYIQMTVREMRSFVDRVAERENRRG